MRIGRLSWCILKLAGGLLSIRIRGNLGVRFRRIMRTSLMFFGMLNQEDWIKMLCQHHLDTSAVFKPRSAQHKTLVL